MKQSKLWFTSDTHFSHAKCIEHCNRPFSSVGEMDLALLHNINSRVQKDHTLYFLGDFCWVRNSSEDNVSKVKYYLDQIKCKNIVWILGNHDPDWIGDLGVHCTTIFELKVTKQEQYILCHYPIYQWHKKRYGAFHLHGHSHGKCDIYSHLAMDVGVDTNNYVPYNLDDIRAIMNKRKLDIETNANAISSAK